MPLNGLGALGSLLGLSRGGEPASKRQKRTDVLDSLGGLDKPRGSKASALVSSSKTASAAVSGLSGSDADKEALRQWLSGEEPKKSKEEAKTSKEEVAELEEAAGGEEASKVAEAAEVPDAAPAAKLDANWRKAYAKATDRWNIDEGSGRGFFFHSEQGLYFEWDQRSGILFQYFFNSGRGSEVRTVPASKDEVPERGPIWTSESPETHAEVWEVLPLPPTDPAAKAQIQEQNPPETREEAPAASEEFPAASDETASADSQTPDAMLMAPPPPPLAKKKKRPPVPTMPAASSCVGKDEDDEPKLPGESEADLPVLGCMGPPPAPASSSAPSAVQEEEEEDDGSKPLMMDDDEEVTDLAAEDAALPEAPTEKAEPSALDLELDMFAGL